jgi:hypothetical protein
MRRLAMILAGACFALMATGAVRAEDNPSYTSWAKCKPGTSTTMLTNSDMGGQSSKTETKSTLVEVTPEKCVIEIVNHIEAAGQTMDTPAQKVDIPKAMATAQANAEAVAHATGGKAEAKAEAKSTQEEVTVPAGKFKARVTENTIEVAGTKTISKVWMSDEVPGGMVKMEATTDGAMKSTSKGELVKIEKK